MRLPSDSDPTRRTEFVRAALREAAQYEAESAPPENLVSAALTRHERAGRDCGRIRIMPARVALACGLVLTTAIVVRLSLPQDSASTGRKTAAKAEVSVPAKNGLQVAVKTDRIDPAFFVLSSLDLSRRALSSGSAVGRRRLAMSRARRHYTARPPYRATHPASAASVWRTETVQCEVVTQTVTPVWIAQPDPETATVVLTPALLQMVVQPDASENDVPPVQTALIPVRLEQENNQP